MGRKTKHNNKINKKAKTKKQIKRQFSENSKKSKYNIDEQLDNIGEKIASNSVINATTTYLDDIANTPIVDVLTGGNSINSQEPPNEIDKFLNSLSGWFDDKEPGFFDKFKNVIEGLISRKIIAISGLEGKSVEEVSKKLAEDNAKIKKINEFLDTKEGKEMLEGISEITNDATKIASKATEKFVDEVKEPIDKLAENATQAGVNAVKTIPGPGNVVSALDTLKKTNDATNAGLEMVEKATDTMSNVVEKIEEPLTEIVEKTKEIERKAETMTNIDKQIQKQTGGNNKIQYGGQYFNKRVGGTINSFKSIANNVIQKM